MNILFIATESVPYCKTGGVADVVHGLARELWTQHHDVRIAIPCYRGHLDRMHMQKVADKFAVPLGAYVRKATIWKSHQFPTTYLIQDPYYFERNDPYGYLDDYERFTFFSRAALEMLMHPSFKQYEGDWFPQIIQGQGWATGLIPAWLPHYEKKDARFAQTRFVLSIYNLALPGIFGSRALRVAQQEGLGIFDQIGERAASINFLGRGVLFADKVVTANPEYGRENPLPESTQNLAAVLTERRRQGDLVGIRNAIDYQEYDPHHDQRIDHAFNEQSLRERFLNKRALQKELHFQADDNIPMLGMVSHLMPGKGFDLFPALKDGHLTAGAIQLVVLADPGVPGYMRMFQAWEQEWETWRGDDPPWMAVFYEFNEKLAQRIYAGCDLFLLPYREEPCGFQQFIAMRYGAVPVVHKTGALGDTVIQYQPGMALDRSRKGRGIGFTFTEYNAGALRQAVSAAVELYQKNKPAWFEIQRHNMRLDFSWFEPAREYVALYEKTLLAARAQVPPGQPLQLESMSQLLQAILEIDGLPGISNRDSGVMLQQAARILQEMLQCDAVYVWTLDDSHHEMQLAAASLHNNETRQSLARSALARLLNQERSYAWKQSSDNGLDSACVPILGLSDSRLAQQEGWVDGRSVPITAHGRVPGRIDALLLSHLKPGEEKWFSYALTTVANSLGFRLETIRLKRESDQILATSHELLQAHTLAEVNQAVLKRAKSVANAEASWLYIWEDEQLNVVEFSAAAEASLSLARLAARDRNVIYIKDWSVALDGRAASLPYRSLLAVPLVNDWRTRDRVVGVLAAAKTQPAAFSRDDEFALIDLATQAAGAVQTALWHERRDQSRAEKLGKLSASLIGGGDFQRLLENVVTTTAEVLEAQAGSLYLIDEETGKLVIQAAAGYHKALLEHKTTYDIGEGTTGWIAQTGKTFKADSWEELHSKSPWRGKFKDLIGGHDAVAFLGIPLKIQDRFSHSERVIGVLKLEDRNDPKAVYTQEDVRLGEMMANIIATVVYNTQVSSAQLQKLSSDLKQLSIALVGGREMRNLVDQVVETMAQVLGAEASSLYLIDASTNQLMIQAASGYQKPLVPQRASYALGEGLTGWIADKGERFRANSTEELCNHSYWKGKYRLDLEDRIARTFLGLPLKVVDRFTAKEKVIGVLKVEDVQTSSHHPESYFTDQDELLVTMMANIIATVVYNTQVSGAQFQKLSSNLTELSKTLAGGREMRELVTQVVETMARALGAEASSLYLIDETSNELVIHAATGYQKPLVDRRATYKLGEGVTGCIAQKGEPFRANSMIELHRHPAWKGKQNFTVGGREPNSFLGLPLKVVDRFTKAEKVIGVLKVEEVVPSSEHPEAYFTDQDELLVTMMANIIATVVYNTQVGETQLQKLSRNLEKISITLAGGREMSDLVDQVVETMAGVLGAEASSLYLIDEKTAELVIQAATGYQRPLVARRATYALGEGVTGWIAEKGEGFRANSLDELRKHSAWQGKQNPVQKNREPRSFLGLPLKVVDRFNNNEKVIGVLKVEDIGPSGNHPEPHFTDQDMLLVAMMANIIATVVYNTQVSSAQQQKLSSNLEEISKALAGGKEMHALVDQVVETMARVLGAEAASLYLIDKATGKLVIQAATGYQKPLVGRRATYKIGEGVTGSIAQKGEPFRANSLDDLHKHPAWRGKQNPGQANREPRSFLGLPLKVEEKVIGVLKVEDIVPSSHHPEPHFTDQDMLLVTMMANIIATVIQNTRQGESAIGNIVQQMGTLSAPKNAAPELLRYFAKSADLGIIDQLATALAAALDREPERALIEAEALFEAEANPALFGRIANWTKNEELKWQFGLFDSIFKMDRKFDNWKQVMGVAGPWLRLKESANDANDFAQAAQQLAVKIAETIQVDIIGAYQEETWCGTVFDSSRILGDQLDRIPLLFQRQGELDENNQNRLYNFAQTRLGRPSKVFLLILWDTSIAVDQLQKMQQRMRIRAMDVVVASTAEILHVLESAEPAEAWRGLVLRQVTTASPFVIVGAVPDAMFFGRDQELTEITQYVHAGRSCAVIGGRRIGKTSILFRLHRVRLPAAGFQTFYHDCSTTPTYEAFLGAGIREFRAEATTEAHTTFSDLLEAPPKDKPLVLLLDEADKLVPSDRSNGWPLFNALRALANSGHAQVVLSGERTLREAMQDGSGPLFNFTNEILIGRLDFRAVVELVTRPMKQLEIELVDAGEIIDRIYNFTSGHPNVVQRLCRRLIEHLNERSAHRIMLGDLDAVIRDPKFQEEDFLNTYWERATPLEQIISLLMAEEARPYRLQAIVDLLAGPGLQPDPEVIKAALNRLVDLRSILKRSQDGYEFAVEAFPLVVAKTTTAEDLLIVLKSQYLKNPRELML